MKYLRNYILFVLMLLIIVTFLNGCTTFKPQTGVWVCDELGIIIDFDNDGGLDIASMTAIGTIKINGETKEIVCGMGPTGSATFYLIEHMDKVMEETSYIYIGYFKNNGVNKMTFKPNDIDKKYIFIKQE